MSKYKKQELEKILSGFRTLSLDKLADKLNRSVYGVALKMRELSEKELEIWPRNEIWEYTRKEIRKHRGSKGDVKAQKNRWRKRYREKHKGIRIIENEWKNKINWNKFILYLNELVDEYGFKQEFAYEAGITSSNLSKYLLGQTTPPAEFFWKIAEISQIPYEEFEVRFRKV